MLNRLLVEPSECEVVHGNDIDGSNDRLIARIDADDPRAEHCREQLRAQDGQTIRAGILDGGATDSASLHWETDAAGPTGPSGRTGRPGRDVAAPLRLELGSAALLDPVREDCRPRVDVLLAMPRPLQFGRLLTMLSSMGVGTLWATGAAKVERRYFSSHLIRDDDKGRAALRAALVEGLVQSGDTAVPRVVVCKSLKRALYDVSDGEAEGGSPTVRLVCHPERQGQPPVRRLRQALADLAPDARVLLAIGPEGGWEEPGELELLAAHGFEQVTLGKRTLRTDVAAISLLAITHEMLTASDDE